MAALTVYSAPDDGRKWRAKHVKHTCSVNKHNIARVASCWFIIYYRLVMDGNKYKIEIVDSKTEVGNKFSQNPHPRRH